MSTYSVQDTATEVGKYVSGNLKRAGMGGTLTFYAQTNLSEMLNAMTVGDVSWDDIKSDQLDKLWGAFVSNAYLLSTSFSFLTEDEKLSNDFFLLKIHHFFLL